MPRSLFSVRSLLPLVFGIIFIALFIQTFSLLSQTNSFSLLLDLDESEGDQAVQSLDVSPNQDVSIQIFGTGIQSRARNDSIRSVSRLSARFEYNATQVVYSGFDAGDVLPDPDVRVEEGTNPTSVEIDIASLSGAATVNSGLIGTIRFRTTDAFSNTEILLVRAQLDRDGQVESAVLNVRVALQVAVLPSPDFDGSGFVDLQDLLLFNKGFGSRVGQEHYEVKYDLNGDGAIGVEDYLIFIQSYGKWVNRAPVFTSKTYVTYFIDENTPGGEPIGDPISATDADGNIVTYHLSGTDVDLFVFDAGTGQLQTKEGITYDYEHRTTYSVIVEASDGQGGTARLLVIIKINDLKEPPSSSPSNFLVIPDNESLTVHYAAVPDERGRPPVRGYHAEIRRGEKGPWGTRKTIYGRTNTSVYYHKIDVPRYQNSFLENGQLYQVRVRAYNSDGASEWSEPVSGIPVYTPPKEEPKLVQFQDGYAIIDLSPVTGEGGKIVVTQADLPATIPQEEVEGVFAEGVVVAVSDAADVPPQAGFTIPGSSSLFDIELMVRVNSRDVNIGDALQASVEICLPVPGDISGPMVVHYDEGASAWELLERQRVDNDVVCGYTDMFSLFGVGVRTNRTPVAVGRFEAQTLRVGDEGVRVDVSGKFSDPDNDVLTYEVVSSDEAIAKVDVSDSVVTLTPVAEGTATVTVTARDAAGSNQTAEQTIAVTVNKADVKLSFGGATVPAQTYTAGREIDDIQLPEATGGTGIIGYTLTPALPDGLVLDGETRTISGTPTVAIETTEYKWRATDGDENTIELLFSIAVEPVNQSPRFISSATFDVRENSTSVGKVVAEDADNKDSVTDYGIVPGADEAQFLIDDQTGVLSFNAAPNYEMPTDVAFTDAANSANNNDANNNEYIVIVSATGGTSDRALTARDTIKVTVTDVDGEAPGVPAAPTIAEATLNSLKVSWSKPTNTGPAITDYDVQYRIKNSGDNFTDAEYDGTDQSTTLTQLATNTTYEVQVRAKSDEGESEWSESGEGITNANQAPTFTDGTSTTRSFAENTAADENIGTPVGATDNDGGTLTYSLEGTDKESFSIVSTSGQLETKANVTYDYETKDEYSVRVKVEDGQGGSVTIAVTISLTDENEAPVFSSAGSFEVAENKPSVGTVVAEDVDADDSITSYALTGGDDQNKFSIVSETGALSFKTAPNYEVAGDVDGNNTYVVEVTATGGAGARLMTATQAITVSVVDENEAPVFAAVSPISVNENITTAIVTVRAMDADTDDSVTGYGIVTDADGSQFDIDVSTGALSFSAAPNYEMPTDVAFTDATNSANNNDANNNEYIVIVSATGGTSDRELTASDTIKVTVTDVDGEAPGKPAAPTIAEATMNSLKISWSEPTNTGPPITAYDVRYILSSETSEHKAIDTNWTDKLDVWTSVNGGALEYTISPLTQNTSYDIQVRAKSGEGESDWSDTLEKMTSANVAPVFTSVSAISVNENSTADIVTVSASDADTGDDIESYGIATGADGGQFEIDDQTGVLTFKVAPNFEMPTDVAVTDPVNAADNNEYIVYVTATGGMGDRELTARDTIKVTVMDVNEAPIFSSAASFEVAENEPSVGKVVAEDVDADDSITSYALTGGDDQNKFSIVSETGALSFKTAPNYEVAGDVDGNNTYVVEVTATGGAGARLMTATQAITVSVVDENEAPVFTAVSPISVNENITTAIVTVRAMDADTDDSVTGYGIVPDADGSQFDIDVSTGALSFNAAPNYEMPTDVAFTDATNSANNNNANNNEYIVIISATSGTGDRVLTGRDTLTVTVTDVDGEAPGKPAMPTVAEATLNSLKVQWTAPTNTGPPITAYDVRYILTSADETDDDNWTVETDAWTSGALEYTIDGLDPNTSYDMQVRAKSAEGMSDWSDTVAGTTRANVAPVITSASSFTVSENITADIVTVSAMDADTSDDIESYGIATGADGEQFSIGASTGVLTFKVAPNYEDPTDVAVTDPSNAAENNEYIVYVTATGGTGDRALTASDTLTVTVTNVNEAPVFSSAASFEVAENEPSVGTVVAEDVDSEDSITGYTLTGGDDQNKFSIVSETGALSFKTAPNYEVAGDVDGNNTYVVEVTATGGAGARLMTAPQAITVSVVDENEAPVFAAVSPISVSENSTGAIVTVRAMDADTDDSVTGYGIVTDADGSQFDIDVSTGALSFSAAPNYEMPTDVAFTDATNSANNNDANNNEYIVIVSATGGTSDRELIASDTIKVTVTDVDGEAPGKPAAPTIAEATMNSLKISWSEPTNTGPPITAYDVRYILSSETSEHKAIDTNWTDKFDVWTSVNGGALEYTISPLTQNTSYDIQVRAKNAEGEGAWSDMVVGTTEANVAPVFTSVSAFRVDENSTGIIVLVSATDADNEDDITGYDIVAGADGSQFSITFSSVAQTGALTFNAAPNYEEPKDVEFTDPDNPTYDSEEKNNEYIVIVSATGGAGAHALTVRDTLTVTVKDVTEPPGKPAAPTIAEATLNSLKVSWSKPTNTGPAITDYDVQYRIKNSGDNFTDTEYDGTDQSTMLTQLATNTTYEVQVRAKSDEGESEWSESGEGITNANQAPTFTDGTSTTRSFAENTAADENIGTPVGATDNDGGTLTYSLEGTDKESFSIVSTSGQLETKANVTYDYETKDEYSVRVKVEDGQGGSVTIAVTISLTDENEAPVFSSAGSFEVAENKPSVGTVVAEDVDADDSITGYTLTGGDDQNKFSIVSETGALSFKTAPNYEVAGDVDGNNTYLVEVTATGGAGARLMTATQAITVSVVDENEAPVFAAVSPISVNENITTAIVTVRAMDADTDDSVTGYGIVTDADGSQFDIDVSTGALSFSVAPNYEMPTDVAFTDATNSANNNDANNNEYIVIISATSGTGDRVLTGRDTLTVTVTDVDGEAPGKPAAPTIAEATMNSLKISWSEPTNTGPPITAYDVRYILTSADETDDDNWTVETDAWTSGALEYTISPLDQNTDYDIQVRAENAEGMSAWSDTVVGTTTQNQAPVFVAVPPQSVDENSVAAIVTVSATDADDDDEIESYTIDTNAADGTQFDIGTTSGVLTFKVAPNFEDAKDVAVSNPSNAAGNNEYIVFVMATGGEDARVLTASDTIKVTVTDENEAPVFSSAGSFEVAENKPSVGTVVAEDEDSEDSITSYALTGGDDQNKFSIVSETGALSFKTASNYEVAGDVDGNNTYLVEVTATGGADARLMTATQAITVNVKDENEEPVITDISPISVNENSTGAIVTVSAMDADTDDSVTGYGIVPDADGSQFDIDVSTGALSFNAAPNYEMPTDVAFTDATNSANNNNANNNEYIVIISATSGTGDRVLTGRDTLTVTVTDVDGEAPGKPAMPTVAEATLNSLKVQWTAPTNTGPPITAYDIRYILSSADETDDDNWTVETDAWTSGALEYTIDGLDPNTSYDMQVRAKSAEGMSDWSDTVAGTTRANVAPVITSASSFTVSENITADIVTVSAMDADTSDDIESYGIATGADGEQFEIDVSTGALSFSAAPNYEDAKDVAFTDPDNSANNNDANNNEYIVIVSATGGMGDRELTARDTIKVTVMDVDGEAPGKPATPTIAASTVNSLKISWSEPTNTGPPIKAYDVRHILTSASDEDKADDDKWTVQKNAWTSGALEYTISSLAPNTSYDVQVRAKSAEGMSEWSDTRVGKTGVNQAPVFTAISPISVNENSTADIVTVSAMDADTGDDIESYGIATGADGEQFSIGASTGVLTFKVAPNYEDPTDVAVTDPSNAADNNEYIVYVTATGGTGDRALTASDTLTVTVTNVNEAPVFSSAASFEVAENEPSVGTVVAEDVDSEDSITGYTLTGGDDQNKFSIVSETGALSFKTAPNYEVAGDVDGNNTYVVEVTATGGAGARLMTATQAITVSVVDENEAPVFTAVSPISVNENSTGAIVTVSAMDADTDDSVTGYGIVTDADGSQFDIDASTGALSFNVAPNYEDAKDVAVTDPSNAAENNEYIVIVSATGGTSDRELTASDTIKVTVTDVDGEAPGKPAAPTIAEATMNSLKISWSEPTNTGPPITAYDVRYILSSETSEHKAIDTNWTDKLDVWTSVNGGALEYTISPLTQNTSYDIQVRAKSGEGESDWSDTLEKMTSANVAPVFTSVSAISVNENSTADIVTVSASDADTGDDIESYGIATGADGGQFEIDDQTGVLTFKVAPNFEMPTDVAVTDPVNAADNNEYIVYVTATGGMGDRELTARDTIKVTVMDVNEAPIFSSAASFEVAENEPSVGKVVAEDVDADDSITSYALTGGDDQNKFSIVSETGALSFKTAPNYEVAGDVDGNNTYVVEVTATGGAGARLMTATQAITVTVKDETEVPGRPDAPTVAAASSMSLTLTWTAPENTGPPITDYDVQYRIFNSGGDFTDAGHDGTHLTVTLTQLELNEAYEVQVSATNDEGTGDWSGSGIWLTSDNFAPRFTSSEMFNVEENTTQVGTVVAEDYDSGDSIGYVIIGGIDQDKFSIDPTTGVLSINTASNFEVRDAIPYIVLVMATSGDGDRERTANQELIITVIDVDEAPAAPMAPTVVAATMNSLMVTWRVPENMGPEITDYDVQYRINSSGDEFTDAEYDGTDLTTTLTPLQANTTYEFQVLARNAEGTGEWSESGMGITNDNVGPSFTSTAKFNVVENNTAVGTVVANDSDLEDRIEGYAITGGADQDKFSIVPNTGVLSFQTVPDFERPTDTASTVPPNIAGNNEYIVEVSATSGVGVRELTREQVITVAVLNQPDEVPGKPDAPTVAAVSHTSLRATWAVPENTGPLAINYDVQYRFSDTNDDFTDARHNGTDLIVSISELIPNTNYEVQVSARNAEGIGEWSDSGEGMTEANQVPTFSDGMSTTRSFAENTVEVQAIGEPMAATDMDGDELTYRLEGTDAESFAFDETNGQLLTSSGITYNYEEKASYSVRAVVSDGLDGETSIDVTITLNDVAEPPGKPDAPVLRGSPPTDLSVTWTAPENTGPPIDDYDVQYSEGNSDNFTPWTHDGMHTSTTISDLSTGEDYAVRVRANNAEGNGEWSEPGIWKRLGTNAQPSFVEQGNLITRELAENTEGGQNIGAPVAATDPNEATLRYFIFNVSGRDNFDIVQKSGQLLTKHGITYDYETQQSYFVTIAVLDRQGFGASINVSINLTDVEERPGKPDAPVAVAVSSTSLRWSWVAPENTGPPITDYDVQYRIKDSGDEFTDANYDGAGTSTTLTPLQANTTYEVQVLAHNAEGTGEWSESGTGITSPMDYDTDDDGLIEISYLEQLNAIRYDMDGDGNVPSLDQVAYASAFSEAPVGMGCPQSGCIGYELMEDLDFKYYDSYVSGRVNRAWWAGGEGWEPIGTSAHKFTAIFQGGGHTISYLYVDQLSQAGLFGSFSGTIQNVGLIDVNVSGGDAVGGLVGNTSGEISNCYVTGQVKSTDWAGGLAGRNNGTIRTSYARVSIDNTTSGGGLVGVNYGTLLACYAYGSVNTSGNAGGLIGWNAGSGSVVNCYTSTRVSGSIEDRTGGFAGRMSAPSATATFSDSYWDIDVTGQSKGDGANLISSNSTLRSDIMGKTASELRGPISYSGIYATWDDEDVTGDEMADAPWHFGTSLVGAFRYPILKVDFNADGTATHQEFGTQRVLGMPRNLSMEPGNGQFTVTWESPFHIHASGISEFDIRYIRLGDDESVIANWTFLDEAWTSGSLEYTIMPPDDSVYKVVVRAGNEKVSGPWSEILGYTSAVPSTWVNFVEARRNGTVPILPDFSYAGYHYFSEPVPDVMHPMFDVTDYGAIPDDNESDQPAIQAAIDAAENNGSGIVFFPPGEFLVFTDADKNAADRNSSITIEGSNIVLRGSGSRDGGTIIRQVNQGVGNVPWGTPTMISIRASSSAKRVTTVNADSDRESHWITVRSTARLSVGQWVRMKMKNSTQAAIDEYLHPLSRGDFEDSWGWDRANEIVINEIHQIAEISGNRVRFHSPIRTPINATHGFTIHTFSPLEEVGIEDICFQGSFLKRYSHAFNDAGLSDAERSLWFGGYTSVNFSNCVNSWMRRCSFINVVRAYVAVNSANISLYQLTTAGNRGHYSVVVQNANSIWTGLIEDITAYTDNYDHGTSITHNASGNVFYYSDMDSGQQMDAHMTNPSYDNLWDRCSGGHLKGSSGGGTPPNHLNRLVLWNYNRLAAQHKGNYSFLSYPFWVRPIIVGIHGVNDPVGRDTGILESKGASVKPSSLFEAQLALRTGSVPFWLNNLRTEWEMLRNTPLTAPTVLPKGKIEKVSLLRHRGGIPLTLLEVLLLLSPSIPTFEVNVSDNFIKKYDTSIVSYSATSSDTDIATVRVRGSKVIITAASNPPNNTSLLHTEGCQITVTATSSEGTTATQTIPVQVLWSASR